MDPIKIRDNIYWVGGVDWNLRNFHGYLTQRGSSYNAYLILDEKITLIDSVKHYLTEEMLARTSTLVDPAKIDVVVCNHVEMDHSGAIPKIMEYAPEATVICSPNGEKGLRAHYQKDWNYHVVQSGDRYSLGKRSLEFVLTPMVHWPDNMVCYMPEENLLFSNDAFGQHIASSERFDDEYSLELTLIEAKKYYANIVLPYSKQVSTAINALQKLDIAMILPSHGLIWRTHTRNILEAYCSWMQNEGENRALIIYDTMWESTHRIAQTIQSVFEKQGIRTEMYDLKENHISDIMTEVVSSKYICVGSPTLNNGMLPTVASFLCYFSGLAPKNRIGLAFGSFGWGGQSIDLVHQQLEAVGCQMLEKIRVKYIPTTENLNEIATHLTIQIGKEVVT